MNTKLLTLLVQNKSAVELAIQGVRKVNPALSQYDAAFYALSNANTFMKAMYISADKPKYYSTVRGRYNHDEEREIKKAERLMTSIWHQVKLAVDEGHTHINFNVQYYGDYLSFVYFTLGHLKDLGFSVQYKNMDNGIFTFVLDWQ